ncbi:phosphonate ABC transporter, permease protein PhnE [Oleidesulfovibrio sp.]|uniref:phosphonate ABC transporter, permease protein PhnE n=1 Tax=Oleidesulfovibrio sp. TaxID=2909707 RepID=UPI003A87A4DF
MNVADREWVRFTPAERLARFAVFLCAGLLLAWSFRTVQVIPEFLMDAPTQVADLFHRMWPVDFGFYYEGVHAGLVETLHIATLGTLLTLVLALPVGVMAARNVCQVPALNWLATLILVSSRSVNSLVWALLFVAIFGPGTLAGVVTIGVRSIGFVGKLFGEALEEAHKGPVEAMRAAGAPWPSIFMKAYWPQVSPAFWSIALFRWDINVRESSVIGLVGAGGIGVALDSALNLFQWTRVSLILVCIFVVVILAEVLVTQIRKRII